MSTQLVHGNTLSDEMNTKLFMGNQLAFKLTFAEGSNFVAGEEALVPQR